MEGDIRAAIKEDVRLAAVEATGLLDTPTEAEFDELVGLAAEICHTPISLFTLIDKERQWFKAAIGLGVRETPRDIAFCAHAIQQQNMFIVEDATKDERFEGNPLVTANPGIRFYAGMPLEGAGGAMLGTLCVIDTVPRKLSESQKNALEVLASQIRVRMELRIERRKLEEALKGRDQVLERLVGSERRFRTFMNNAPFLSYIKDAKGRFVFYNDRFAERFKVSSQDWLGKTDFDIWPREAAQKIRNLELEVMSSRKMMENTEETTHPGEAPACWKTYRFPWWNERGELMLGGFAVDVTKEIAHKTALEEANEGLKRLATVDPLTGLSNRRVLEERVEFEFSFAARHKTPFSVVMLDLDNFKKLNDQMGHAVGDEALRHVAKVLKATMRTTDVSARYGGEEFVVLLPGADTDGAVLFAERVRQRIGEPGAKFKSKLTASFGVASRDATTTSGLRMVHRADEAMYEAKRSGKDRIVTHRDRMAREMAALGGDGLAGLS